ncbi:MAG: GNAT family N-acetyltransferase [Geminicoccaceae bacterium]|nr:MAG: GNAT family N-acetyltransferase [Geminicoccaceae bacterium]
MVRARQGQSIGTPQAARLVAPHGRFAASFVEALAEGFCRGNRPRATPRELRQAEGDFTRFMAARLQAAQRIVPPSGERLSPVPASLHWLVVGGVFVGELSFRRRLNAWLVQSGGHIGYGIRPTWRRRGFGARLLALGLDEARAAGLSQVLLTCHDDNAASAGVIEANGGILAGVVDDVFGGGPLRRYWIDLGAQPCPA